jgi:hypothetical protein
LSLSGSPFDVAAQDSSALAGEDRIRLKRDLEYGRGRGRAGHLPGLDKAH